MSSKTVIVSLSLAALAAAQSLSSQCTNGISGLQNNNEANNCLALNQFNNIFLTPSNSSIITGVDNWLKAVCAAPACSNSTIESVFETVTTACAADIGQLGASNDTVNSILPMIQQYIGTAKELICLADTKTDMFCVSETGANAEKSLNKPLSLDNLMSLYGQVLGTSQSPVDTSIFCTDCTKGAIAVLRGNTALTGGDISTVTSGSCGQDFAASATSLPAGIVIGTGTAVPKGSPAKLNADKGAGASTLAVAGSLSAVVGAVLVGLLA